MTNQSDIVLIASDHSIAISRTLQSRIRLALGKLRPWFWLGALRRLTLNSQNRTFFYERERKSHQAKSMSNRVASKLHGYGLK